MVSKVFLSSLITLVLFNIAFYLTGFNTSILSVVSVLNAFLTVGIIAILVSLIPTTSASGSVKWFLSLVIMLSIFYSISFHIVTWEATLGLGLVNNLTNVFSPDLESLTFLPWLFFNSLGLIGVMSGITGFSSGGD